MWLTELLSGGMWLKIEKWRNVVKGSEFPRIGFSKIYFVPNWKPLSTHVLHTQPNHSNLSIR